MRSPSCAPVGAQAQSGTTRLRTRLRNSLWVVVMGLCLIGCAHDTPYHHFEATANEGWDKEDTLHFNIDTLQQSGRYTLSLEVRTSELYPYRNLSLMVEETVFPSRALRRFYVMLEPRTATGEYEGPGMSRHDLTRVLAFQYLHCGDSIHINVFHKMRRVVLPGVTDIGVKLTINN